ncbi:MAG: type II secretion system F family protein [bacterium]
MNFIYKAVTGTGEKKEGTIDAINKDAAISGLQRRGLIIVSIKGEEEKSIFQLALFESVPMRDIVVLSRQMSTLFDANVSALKAFTMLSTNVENKLLKRKLVTVTDDIQSGNQISAALAKHPDVFSEFYVNMVKAGEESGKLNQIFSFLADYLDRQYALTSKTKSALIYPGFVIGIFFVVMTLMFTFIIPKLETIILQSGSPVPIYTQIVFNISNVFVNYGLILLIVIVGVIGYLIHLAGTKSGKAYLDGIKIKVPAFGELFRKLYLSRIADNMNTMLSSGISIVHSLEITSKVVGNKVYEDIMNEAVEAVKAGKPFSDALEKHNEIPKIMVQMIRVGEETGGVANILKTLSAFYAREVNDAVNTLVSLIEPVMIVLLGLGVGTLLVSVLVPIYNMSSVG